MAREEIDFKEYTKTKAFVEIRAHKQSTIWRCTAKKPFLKSRTTQTNQNPTYLARTMTKEISDNRQE